MVHQPHHPRGALTSLAIDLAATTLLYAAEQFDAGLKLYYLRARYYDQTIGRFSSFDSYEGRPADPANLHK